MSNIHEYILRIDIYDLKLEMAHLDAEHIENIKNMLKMKFIHSMFHFCI